MDEFDSLGWGRVVMIGGDGDDDDDDDGGCLDCAPRALALARKS